MTTVTGSSSETRRSFRNSLNDSTPTVVISMTFPSFTSAVMRPVSPSGRLRSPSTRIQNARCWFFEWKRQSIFFRKRSRVRSVGFSPSPSILLTTAS
jgi:hypothetical protein